MEIIKGKVNRAQRVTIYGPEGIGKSTLASLFPNPLFMDIERGTDHLDVARTPQPASFALLKQYTEDFNRDPQGFQTLVVDTADWAERLGAADICAANNLSSLGGAKDYGRSYNLLEVLWSKWLNTLTEICMGHGVHIVVLAHATTRKFELPEESGAYDKWETKLNQKKTAPLLKEWSDMILFACYKVLVVDAEDNARVKKGIGGGRVLRTTHNPCWDAKNRHGLPPEISLTEENKTILPAELQSIFYPTAPVPALVVPVETVAPPPEEAPPQADPVPAMDPPTPKNDLPTALIQLMTENAVTEDEIRRAVAVRGHYPVEAPIMNYDPDFVDGVLIAAWPKVMEVITENRKGESA